MKVAIIGGAGVFGSRLARMIVRDGHDVVLIGRNAPVVLADELGASARAMDRDGDLSVLWALKPDIVIDAAGPFHAYGDDPYRLPRAAIAQGVHYLDLADDADFCTGIVALDGAAKANGVIALSGVSSVPALSSAIVADLTKGADQVDRITTAILPGNRAPRGRAVVDSILHQAGTDFDVTIDGAPVPVRSWSRPRMFDLGQGLQRRGYMIRVPDQSLLPAHFKARTVAFFAGLELAIFDRPLAAWSWLRHLLRLQHPGWLGRMTHWVASRLVNFGTQDGGMQVTTVARHGTTWRQSTWDMIVRDGHGPWIPGVAARALLRDLAAQPAGAGPAIGRMSRAAAEAAMSDLSVQTLITQADMIPLFARVLGDDFCKLPILVRDSHATYGPRRWTGTGSVTRGTGLWPRLIAGLFRFPKATDKIDVIVMKTPHAEGETWERRFGTQLFQSHLAQGTHGMTERFGLLTFALGLHVADDALHFPVRSGRIGPIPIPRFLLPRSVAREHAHNGNFCFDVALYAPITGQKIVHYRGTLARNGGQET